ncbi:MAG: CoA transferase [Firmicutes bacterium]|nr:CoA transferase [Bacillota bacterium]
MKTLESITVLDLTQAYSGPLCTTLLADYGANVIKIEPAGVGDMTRYWSPIINGYSAYNELTSRNKKSVSLNLKAPEGKKIFLDLVKKADVIVENFKPGTAAKLEVDYESARKVKPDIIYCSISGFGQTGPEAKSPAYAIIAEAMSGHMDLTGFPETAPCKTGLSIGDSMAAVYGAFSIMMSLFQRSLTGEGQYIDVSMLDCLFFATESAVINTSVLPPERVITRSGNREIAFAPYDCYKASDGYYVLGGGTERHWISYCEVTGREDLLTDDRFKDNDSRKKNELELTDIISEFSSKHTRQEMVDMLSKVGIPCAPVLNIREAVVSPQIQARNMLAKMENPKTIGAYHIPNVPVKFSVSESSIDSPAPLLGEHNEEILSELGYSPEDIKELLEKGVL